MRIWSLHPKYLDTKGLVALWRETLLAKNVLEGNTKGYKNHPQLNRFKKAKDPLEAVNFYLSCVWDEANNRNYKFDKSKFKPIENIEKIVVNSGQIEFEMEHLLKKLKSRDVNKYTELLKLSHFTTHPLFIIKIGSIEDWEKPSKLNTAK